MQHLFHSWVAGCVALTLLVYATPTMATDLAPIQVEGDVAPEVGEVEHSEFTGTYSHIGLADLSVVGDSLATLISRESGIQHRQAGALGSYSSLTIRGATSAQTNVYLDGVLLNNAGNGSVDLSQFELLNLGSIDVYRGSTPAQLGISNIGGSVNLRSPAASDDTASVLIGTGSFGEKKAQFALRGARSGQNLQLAFSHHTSDNEFEFSNDNGTPLNPSDDSRQYRYNADFSRQSLLFKLDGLGRDRRRYDLLVQYSDRERGIPHWRNIDSAATRYDTRSSQVQLSRRSRTVSDSGWNHSQTLYLNQNAEHYDDRQSQVGLGNQKSETTTTVGGLKAYWDSVRERGTFAINTDLRYENLDNEDALVSKEYSATRTSINSVMQLSLYRFDERLLMTPAIRLNSLSDQFDGVLRSGDYDNGRLNATTSVGFRWAHSDSLQINANVGQHQREPTFFELFGDRGFYIGSADLVAEEGVNMDVGMQWQTPGNPDRVLRVTWFGSQRDELISSVYDAQGIGRSENTGAARVYGLETAINWNIGSWVKAAFNLTWQDTENKSGIRAYRGKRLPGEARLAGNLSLQYNRRRWGFWYQSDWSDGRYYDAANVLPAEDSILHNLGVSYGGKAVEAVLRLDNLGNDNIEDFNGFPKPGRTIRMNLTYHFEGEKG